jgi:DNA-directed RNA polymerase specialized sigma24 family protein
MPFGLRWVFSIAHDRALDARRRRTRTPMPIDASLPAACVVAPVEPFDAELVIALAT